MTAQLGDPLTPRELQILALMADGLSNSAIGGRLGMSGDTARTHVGSLTRKLGAADRGQLVVLARVARQLSPPREPVVVCVEVPVSVPGARLSPAAEAELVAVAEGILAGRPSASLRRQAGEALSVAGRRGPGGRPLVPVQDRRVAS